MSRAEKASFFALELPSAVQKPIVQWRATHFPEDAGRPVAADNLSSDAGVSRRGERGKQRALAASAASPAPAGLTPTLDDAGRVATFAKWYGSEPASRRACAAAARQHVARAQAASAAAAIRARSRFTRILPCGAISLARRCRSRPSAFAGRFR